jgi:uncharacterized membrane protein YecN with MAPEG domain
MQFPLVTSIYAALFGILFTLLSAWVGGGRHKNSASFGDAGDTDLRGRIRAHANFAEYVPLILILVALLEARHTSIYAIHILLLALLIGRLLHPFGMVAADGSRQMGVCRGIGASLTMLVLIVSSVMLLLAGLTGGVF